MKILAIGGKYCALELGLGRLAALPAVYISRCGALRRLAAGRSEAVAPASYSDPGNRHDRWRISVRFFSIADERYLLTVAKVSPLSSRSEIDLEDLR